MKKKTTLIITLILVLFSLKPYGQNTDSLNLPPPLTHTVDTITVKKLETTPKDDSLAYWQGQNNLQIDKSEIKTSFYPKNLPDSVYIKRLKNAEQVFDLSYNPIVKKYIRMYTERSRNQVETMLGRSKYYFPIFEETLDKYDMPLELKYLPIIESALKPTARSWAGANGLWQFMYGTARNMKLEISSFVDERRDPVKATDAAARYLSKLYDIYHDWALVIAAYNCGPGNVNRAIRRCGGKTNYWDIYYALPRETRGYVPAFIAALYTFEYHDAHNLVPVYNDLPSSVDTIMINNFLHFDQIAAVLNISKEEIRKLNPMYRRDVIPAKNNKPYPLILPDNDLLRFIDADTTVYAYQREKYFPNNTLVNPTTSKNGYFVPADVKGKDKIIYTVKTGDNVGYISSWFHVRSSDLRYWNNIRRNMIREGQKLAIYVPKGKKNKYKRLNTMSFAQKQASIGKSTTTSVQKRTKKPLDPNYVYHTVRRGDTLWDIAREYAGISSDDIMKLNHLSGGKGLYVGQRLKIKRKG